MAAGRRRPGLAGGIGDLRIRVGGGTRTASLVLGASLVFVLRDCQLPSPKPTPKTAYSVFTTPGSAPKYPVGLR